MCFGALISGAVTLREPAAGTAEQRGVSWCKSVISGKSVQFSGSSVQPGRRMGLIQEETGVRVRHHLLRMRMSVNAPTAQPV